MVSVTEDALCITVEHGGHEYPGKIAREDMVSLSSGLAMWRSPVTVHSEADMLVLKMKDDRQVIFRNFGRTEAKVMAFKLIQYLIPK